MSERLKVVAFEDLFIWLSAIDDALKTPDATAGIKFDGIDDGNAPKTLPEAVERLQQFATGYRPMDCLLLDGNLGRWDTDLPESFYSGEKQDTTRGKKGLLRLGRAEAENPNQFSLSFMSQDTMPGSDARNIMRLIDIMRKRGLKPWLELAVVGFSIDPMSRILAETGLEVDYDLGKELNPIKIIQAIQEAQENRLEKLRNFL
ncbi:hypothetical protein IPL68_06670 [Candidatus Saccharibacteria bacterium]|nr:MAG: hypothetical protein IPL68_06670 [Candidatus Saccharibacteria bacterium]